MKIHYLLSALLILSACSTTPKEFPNKDLCFLLFDLKKDQFVEVINEKRCEQRFPAASTFKVALSVMAFDSGVFKNETTPAFRWDGEKSVIESWNKDQYPTSWMRDSVVWVSQLLTAKMGEEKVKNYLSKFAYGNQDFSAGLKYAWLTPAPFIQEPMANSLKISAYEQISFLKKLWRGELKVTPESQSFTKKLMTIDVSSQGNTLTGKTGSGFRDANHDLRLGWFVGHLESEKSEYLVVLNYSDKQKVAEVSYGGREAKETALKLLSEKKLW
jgi:beta-lactamase class D